MIRVFAAVAFAMLFAAAPASAQMSHGAGHAMSGWKELDSYHMLMMATWHPIKDKGELAPLREMASKMVGSAETLAASTAPKACATPELKKAGETLVTETKRVAEMVVNKANDSLLTLAMHGLHEHFKVLAQGCKPAK